ncbi:citrate synthase [Psychromonas antarctica]|uniref:citrate synthase n=1 Tax=Psychromonas antarctica TaxID=67573 RepID=UPI001EE95E4A|nr:citrate synthase [Psychromonas antarctica]MCG6202209.1 citrate synthase [Psychromonas antarctica]
MNTHSLTITDNRTGKSYDISIQYGTYPNYGASINAIDLRQIKTTKEDFGLLTYDPGYTNTASCKSDVTFLDGEEGILRYRGYPIEQLAEKSTYLETAYLLLHGELPNVEQLQNWRQHICEHTFIHENIKKLIDNFQYDAHPMGILVGSVGAMSTFYPEAKNIQDHACRYQQICRLIGKMPTLAAFAYRHSRGLPYAYPDEKLSYIGNFMSMLWKGSESKYQPDPVLEKAIDVLFILHADHEQNCSTSSMRMVASSYSDPLSAISAAIAALYGPRHGGANEAVLQMLKEIGSVDNVPNFIKSVKSGEAGRLMGFGHRVYKSYDPRAKICKQLAREVFAVTGANPLIDIALELERIALQDDYFISRQLYPNVDFYSGLIYQAMGFPVGMFPVLFAIARTAGWVAQWQEFLLDPDNKIARPRQIYCGHEQRDYVPLDKRE